jgi:hypothetical protein
MSQFNQERNEISSNNDNISQGQKCIFTYLNLIYLIIALFTFFSNMKKKLVKVFVDLSDDENENNFQSKIEKNLNLFYMKDHYLIFLLF